MLKFSRLCCGAIETFVLAGVLCGSAAAQQERPLGVVEDFARFELGPVGGGHLDHFRWSEEERERVRRGTRIECVPGEGGRGKRLRIRIDDALPSSPSRVAVLRLNPHFPPEADVVRIHGRVASGAVQLFLGGPTAYFADSDVFTHFKSLSADSSSAGPAWDFSLNHPLVRNFRRAGFSTEARRIYYARWAQEPLGIYVTSKSHGEFYLDRIELVSVGEGRPFREFPSADVRPVRKIADFEDGRLEATFNLYMADGETEWFEQSWKRERPLRFAPVERSIATDPATGKKSLVCVGRYAEEVHCTGLHVSRAAEANALRLELTLDAPGQRNTVVGLGPAEAIDLLLFTAPSEKPFPWDRFGPAAELRRGPGPGFDFQLSYRAIREWQDVDFAIYHARRYVRPNERTTLVVPTADFACIYGSGSYRDRLLADAAPNAAEAIAAAWLVPWCRAGRQNTPVTTRIDELDWVRVPGRGAEHRSFWRIDDRRNVFWTENSGPPQRSLQMYLQNDGAPGSLPEP